MPPNEVKFGKVSVNNFEQTYVECGDGEVVVLVPPSLADIRFWGEHLEIIASRYKAIAFNLRYFGDDPWPDDGEIFSIQTHVDDLGAFIRDLDVGPINLVGTSYSSGVCLTLATQRPELMKRLFIYEPSLASFVTEPKSLEAFGEDMMEIISAAKSQFEAGDLAAAARKYTDGANNEDGAFFKFTPAIQAMILDNAGTMPLLFSGPPPPDVTARDLQGIKLPVTIALGERSRKLFQIVAETAHELIPNSELKIVEGGKHFWPLMEPKAFCKIVLECFDSS